MPAITTLAIEAPDGRRQKQTRDLRDEDGVGTVVEQVLEFSPDGVRLVSLRIRTTVAGITNNYYFAPPTPPLVLRPGLPEGDRTEFTLQGDGVTIRTIVSVGSAEQVRVGNETVRAVAVTFDSTFSGALTGTQQARNKIDSARGLTVREEVDTDVSNGSVRARSNYRASLQELRPT